MAILIQVKRAFGWWKKALNGFVNTSWSYLPNGFLVGKGGFSRYREKISAVMPVSGEATVMW